jgi:beta-lactamase regulating signal transducer with metallopeptidase domain
MSTFVVDAAASVVLWITVKASVLLGAAAILQLVLHRRASAATKHLLWTLAIVSVLVLPALSLVLPEWKVTIRTAATDAPVMPIVNHVDASVDQASPSAALAGSPAPSPSLPHADGLSLSSALLGLYVAGVIGILIRLTFQHASAWRFVRRAIPVQDDDWTRLLTDCAGRMGVRRRVRLLRSLEQNVPVAFGIWRPSIVIPLVAATWSDDRRRAVILHELAHVARFDCLTQALARAACATYWFHPAVWWVARRLRIERELACDDRVLAAGTKARDYAGHLLEIAYALGGRSAPALAVSMARPHQLEGRMLAALDDTRNRRVPSFRFLWAIATIAAVLLGPLAVAVPSLVAADRDAESAPPLASGLEVLEKDAQLDPYLRRVHDSLRDSAYRVVRLVRAAASLAQENQSGTWEVRPTSSEGTVRLRLVEVNSSSDSNIPIDRLEGLTAAQLAGSGGPVQFRLRRDAGTFTFEGVTRNGVGAGTFGFAPDPNFAAELAKRGFARPSAREQYQMARHDIGFAFVDELNTQGYSKPETAELVRAGQHGVQVTYLREMGALGYRLGSLEPLITLRDHGVTPAYVRELQELGYKGLSADDLRRARDHGVTPEYVRGMRDGGYVSLPLDALINARDHGVTPDYVRGMRDGGYGSLPLDDLINARDHGVSPEFVRALGEAGHSKLPLDQLIRVRDHGVSPEYVRDMRQLGYALPINELVQARDHGVSVEYVRAITGLGYSGQSMESLVRLRDHGVTPEYAKDLKALGYDRLTLDDLIMLRDHGLTPERIRAANTRAGTRLPIDMLKSLAAGGMR